MKIERISPRRAKKRLKKLAKKAKTLKRQLPELSIAEIFDPARRTTQAGRAWVDAEKHLEAAVRLEYKIYEES